MGRRPYGQKLFFLTLAISLTLLTRAPARAQDVDEEKDAPSVQAPVATETPPPPSSPQGLMNKLLAPGPLMEGHRDLEQVACLSCHSAGNGVPNDKCLECHKDIRKSQQRKSFHQFHAKTACMSCHSDHKGRAFDSTAVNEEAFNHKQTGFALSKGHADLDCSECHTKLRTKKATRPKATRFFGESTSCTSCHAKDDPHRFPGALGKAECSLCHAESSWKVDIKFDHVRDGNKYALKGKHAKIECAGCHKPVAPATGQPLKWTGLKPQCTSCHADFHGFTGAKTSGNSKLGPLSDCKTCHEEKSWKEPLRFNHNTQTSYVLDGKHVTVPCNDCHGVLGANQSRGSPPRQYVFEQLAAKNCQTCHKNPHTGKFAKTMKGKTCESCHQTSGWAVLESMDDPEIFKHNKQTRFALSGKHREIDCKACHVQGGKNVYKFANVDKQFCVSCHADIHKKQFSEDFPSDGCAACHSAQSFTKLKDFDHDKTRFALTGAHLSKVKKCEQCHVPTKAKLATKPPRAAGKFLFGHADSDFCEECHKNVHDTQFHPEFAKKTCTSCHTTENFKDRKAFDHQATAYPLRGAHKDLTCEKCHKPTKARFPPPSTDRKGVFLFPDLAKKNCATCHKDPHRGKRGPQCMACHNEDSKWSSIDAFHRNFTLTGAHNLLTCEQCHFRDLKLTGMNDKCILCHRKDDNHRGALPDCGACHTQQFWQMTTWSHSLTTFPLLGAHRVAECNACHRTGLYQGTPTDCIFCHAQDARGVTQPNHSLSGMQECGQCHNQFSFGGKTR